ncbi:Putative teichuronic acid biosynthesis glycosyltransferase TuaC [Polystyrenella longa]|uniref:Teichuronic acid biosynthesis glycosyltransferase TuaC n=1 Tax=Polystyrenella longa TaxID=2528007 RepID=A0A518CH58_9PLAN|nr:glycosyltransferase family 4 protein [Polystyrenella longa]QDU78569.1 Putative teichuronic acid biosynthesis glycosyltransferase TuaC [Polystyrenella longa]
MKIVHVITRLVIGGAQENTLLNVEDLANLYNDDVTLVIGPDAGPEGTLLERASQGKFRLITVPSLHRAIGPWNDFRCYRELQTLFRELKPDIVHTHSSKAGILGRAAATAVGVPVVHTVHGSPFHPWEKNWKNSLYQRLEKRAFSQSGHTISVCNAMTEQYVAAGIGKPENYTTIYSGMELEPFLNPSRTSEEMREELGIPDDAIVIGKVARLFELKGHEFLLQIAPELIQRHPNVRFLFVGDGVLREQMQQMIASRGLTDHFHFTGLVPPHEVPHYLQAMDIVVHTSLREGLPRVLPQALLSKKPIIAFNLDGSPEVCRHEETGLLVEPESTSGLLEAITRLIETPALGQQLAERGYELCLPMFDHEEMTRQVRQVYERVLGTTEGHR